MPQQGVRHYEDTDGYYNGSDGRWTRCGEPWEPQLIPAEDCPECARLGAERLEAAKALWLR